MASGTLRQVIVAGIKLKVSADNDAKLPGGKYKNEPVPHSGGAEQKKVKVSGSITGINVIITALAHEQLQQINDRTDEYQLSLVDIQGNTWRTTGFIDYDGRQTADNKGSLDMHPTDEDGFVLFAA